MLTVGGRCSGRRGSRWRHKLCRGGARLGEGMERRGAWAIPGYQKC